MPASHIGARRRAWIIGLVLVLGTGCETISDTQREQIGTVLGGAVGAVIGSELGDDELATYLGAAAGAFVGNQLARYLNERDRELLALSTYDSLRTGEESDWSNDETGVTGSTKVVDSSTREEQVAVPVRKDRIDQVPPLELVGDTFVATSNANVRGGPGTDYARVDGLVAGDAVHVVGRVENAEWYLVSADGAAGSGFVYAPLLDPASREARVAAQDAMAEAAEPDTAEAEVEKRVVAARQECRSVEQQVRLADGTQQTETVTACRTPNGWQIQGA